MMKKNLFVNPLQIWLLVEAPKLIFRVKSAQETNWVWRIDTLKHTEVHQKSIGFKICDWNRHILCAFGIIESENDTYSIFCCVYVVSSFVVLSCCRPPMILHTRDSVLHALTPKLDWNPCVQRQCYWGQTTKRTRQPIRTDFVFEENTYHVLVDLSVLKAPNISAESGTSTGNKSIFKSP